eukprot:gene17147-5396_t
MSDGGDESLSVGELDPANVVIDEASGRPRLVVPLGAACCAPTTWGLRPRGDCAAARAR